MIELGPSAHHMIINYKVLIWVLRAELSPTPVYLGSKMLKRCIFCALAQAGNSEGLCLTLLTTEYPGKLQLIHNSELEAILEKIPHIERPTMKGARSPSRCNSLRSSAPSLRGSCLKLFLASSFKVYAFWLRAFRFGLLLHIALLGFLSQGSWV